MLLKGIKKAAITKAYAIVRRIYCGGAFKNEGVVGTKQLIIDIPYLIIILKLFLTFFSLFSLPFTVYSQPFKYPRGSRGEIPSPP